VTEVDWISGACIFTKKEYFNKGNQPLFKGKVLDIGEGRQQ